MKIHPLKFRKSQIYKAGEPYKGKVSAVVFGPEHLESASKEYQSYAVSGAAQMKAQNKKEKEQLVASGAMNPYEDRVAYSAIQGHYLFIKAEGIFKAEKLSEFPKEICQLTQLNELILSDHGLQKVPTDIKNLVNLKILNLSGNQIATLPTEFGKLESLVKLDISDNPLISVPDSIAQLTKLKSINLKNTKLPPTELEKLAKLLPNCKIKS